MDIGKAVGGVLLVAATAAIWLWPEGDARSPAEEVIRPVRSVIVAADARMPDLRFVGTVKANESRTLTFKQSGRVEKIPVSKGQAIRKGERLAWLDPLDFRNRLAQAEAAVERDRLTYRRKSDAAAKNAISQEELSQAEAQLKQSEAAWELAKRELAETELLAPFDCTVADIPAAELDMVGASTPIVKIQDLSKLKIDVVYPEAAVIVAKKLKHAAGPSDPCVEIVFDSYPSKRYPAKFVEYVGTADEKTQTYRATYEMTPPAELNILPGMSATLHVSGDSYRYEDGEAVGLVVPESAVASGSDGAAYACRLVETSRPDVFAVTRVPVELGHTVNGGISILKGLAAGDRIATAGVTLLADGQQVRLSEK